jgi:Flp pilus assembly protein TadD
LAAAVIVLAGIAAYADTLIFPGPFIFDDQDSIPENPTIRTLWPIAGALSPPRGITASARPIVNLSLAVCYAIGGLNVVVYHVGNLVIHLLGGLVLFGIVRRTLLLPGLAERFGRASTTLAFAAAILWVLHPLQTAAVTYLIQRTESLMGLFYLLTIYLVIRGATASGGWAWYVLAVVACALGMGSKEVMVTAPLVVLLYDRTFLAGSFLQALRRRWALYLPLAASWAVLAGLVWSSGRETTAGFGLHGLTPAKYALSQFGVILHYLRLCFYPDGLCLDYAWPAAESAGRILPQAIVILALAGATAAGLVRWKRWGFLGAWFFVILAPTSSIMPIADLAFEHRMYLPLAEVVVLVVMAGYLLFRLLEGAGVALVRAVTAAALIAGAGLLGGVTALRNYDYRSPVAIWLATVDVRPGNPRAHCNLGVALMEAGKVIQAVEHFQLATELKADYADAHNNLGVAYGRLRQYELAVRQYDRALELEGRTALLFYNRGRPGREITNLEEAIGDPTFAIDLRKEFANIYYNRGIACWRLDRLEEAVRDLSEAIKLQPNLAEAYNSRGNAYRDWGRFEQAIADFNTAIRLKPALAAAYNNRAVTYWKQGDYDKAWQDVKTCRRLGVEPKPEFIKALTESSGRSQ